MEHMELLHRKPNDRGHVQRRHSTPVTHGRVVKTKTTTPNFDNVLGRVGMEEIEVYLKLQVLLSASVPLIVAGLVQTAWLIGCRPLLGLFDTGRRASDWLEPSLRR